jgi:hypothetical protein
MTEALARPFRFFLCKSGRPDITVTTHDSAPPYKDFPAIRAAFSSPRNIVFSDGTTKIIDYFNQGVVIQKENQFHIYGTNRDFLQESFYLLVLSRFGQYCDSHRMMRIHALALSCRETAIILPMLPGSGKSTLAVSMLKTDGIGLISDDSPLVDKFGQVLPFPMRIGTNDVRLLRTIPGKYQYKINRMEFGIKTFIDIDFWQDRIQHKPFKQTLLFISYQMLNGVPSIHPASFWMAYKSLVRDAVVGVGLFQGVEFLFSHNSWEVLKQIKTGFMRLNLCLKLLRKSRVYSFALSRNPGENAALLRSFLQTELES